MWVTVQHEAESCSICCEIPVAFRMISTANTAGLGFAAGGLIQFGENHGCSPKWLVKGTPRSSLL